MTVDATAVARVVGIETAFKDLRGGGVLFKPQRIAVLAQGATASAGYPTTKFQATSSKQVGDLMGYGSPAHLVVDELLPTNGDGVGTIPITIYPLNDDYSAVASTGTITPAGSQTKAAEYRARIAGIYSEKFTIAAGASVAAICTALAAAINGVLKMPVTAADNATNVGLTSKWAGLSANDIVVEIIGESLGTTFTIVQPQGGLANPALATALAQIGNVWESLLINALNPHDTAALDELNVWGEGRWNPLVRKPALAFRGNRDAGVAAAIASTETRTLDRTNVQVVAPGSPNLPCVIAAAEVVRIARLANNNPPHDYGSQRCPTLTPGLDSVQWTHAMRDQAVKGGSSTIEVKDGVVNISDVVTSYAPTGEAVPAYRFAVDVVKLMTIVFNLDLIFATAEWDGAPLIPDDQPTINPTAKRPLNAIAAVNAMIDSLADYAIISDPKTAKERTTAVIDAQNPKRLNVGLTVQLVGNANIIDVNFNFGFYFGAAEAA